MRMVRAKGTVQFTEGTGFTAFSLKEYFWILIVILIIAYT